MGNEHKAIPEEITGLGADLLSDIVYFSAISAGAGR
jgi:hypothetical protein